MNPAKTTDAQNLALGGAWLYNVISAPGTSAPTLGQPQSLYNKKSLQSALGVIASKSLPLSFTKACAGCSVRPHAVLNS